MNQISARNLTLGYGRTEIVHDISHDIQQGEFVGIIGPSGAGKSTLLMALNATVSVLAGQLTVLDQDVGELTARSLKELRSQIGVIFQSCNLVPRLSVFDNIASGMLQRKSTLAALLRYYSAAQYEEIYQYLKTFGIESQALQRCDRLSGGQKQRVAIARATAQKPRVILADEPISALDPVSARTVMENLRNANQRYGITVIANLHQLDYARKYCQRMIGLQQGRIIFDGAPADLNEEQVSAIYRTPGSCGGSEEDQAAQGCPGVVVNA